MKFKELLDKYPWDEIVPVLIQLYPDQEKSLPGYQQVFETLRTLAPVETNMRIFIENVWDEFSDEYYASVSGKDGTLWKDETPEVVMDDERSNQEVSYGIESTDWAEWLGMMIDVETLANYADVEIIGHCLWEMTFFGYSQEAIKQRLAELGAGREESSVITLDQLSEDSKIIPSGPFKGKKIEFAPTTGVDRFWDIAEDFMRRIFGFESGDYLITDESSLFDFTGVDEMEMVDIQKKIVAEYDLDVSDIQSGNLVEIFSQIHRRDVSPSKGD